MRLMVLVVSLLLPSLLLSVTAGAQVVVPPPPVNQEGMKDFCVFANQIYSLGAQVCVPGANAGMRCVSSEGSKSGGRAFWSFDAKEWPLAPGWRCGTGG
ncbi:MAG TPA: hypothetical protein VGI22_23075 [Xanthobacteraceae bacterium]|jgi:hypothetical protein